MYSTIRLLRFFAASGILWSGGDRYEQPKNQPTSSVCLDYASGNRRCIVTAYFDGSIRKAACAYDSCGDFRYTVENQSNTMFRLGVSTRDLLEPLF